MTPPEFDRFAVSYEQDLAKSLSVTGEERNFYAQGRIDWTAQCLSRVQFPVRRVLDYGCGDGSNLPMLAARFKTEQALGVDVSSASIARAIQSNSGSGIAFLTVDEWKPDRSFDLAFCNGVFHHIPVPERKACLAAIRAALRSEGVFAFWENNPWNPGTRYVMSQCAFDEKAITIAPSEARRMLQDAGFRVLHSDSLFYFPRQLRWLRPLERWLRGVPLGGQYLVLCQNHS